MNKLQLTIFLQSLGDRDVDAFLDAIEESPDIDERIGLCEELIAYLPEVMEDYEIQEIEEDIKDLAII